MRILLVNPNSTASMTAKIADAARAVAAPGTEIVAATVTTAPASIESRSDESRALSGLLDTVLSHADTIDATVVACFDDPGISALRELTYGPVVAICEAACQVASVLSARYSVVTTVPRAVNVISENLLQYGLDRKCLSVRSAQIPVLALETAEASAAERIRAEIRCAMEEDGAEAIVLGCAGMANLAIDLSHEFQIPVIDGVVVAVKQAESLVTCGLTTSKSGTFAPLQNAPLPA
ncbi:aspartate/glutamate racemase family protein [Thalassorhabdomicrobium marinisediminis]|uniref:aspartate/glutamate racemase family protein n=1 Tax=Thalassorhabdomicrobium marinisediminis TaxID=2170577 RepID=UPI00248F9158|nr:aspartate/glutamate racemase family protein [Thalassorhabdomicrobium marinisediminis]